MNLIQLNLKLLKLGQNNVLRTYLQDAIVESSRSQVQAGWLYRFTEHQRLLKLQEGQIARNFERARIIWVPISSFDLDVLV